MRLKIFRQGFKPALAYLVLIVFSMPIFLGFLWLINTTFSTRTEGLKSLGWTLNNWSFLWKSPFGPEFQSIWFVTLNTFLLAIIMTIIVIFASSTSAYALSRMKFAGRKGFLSATLILHAFPSVTLLIPIYFILRWITKIPIIGQGLPLISGFGFNTIGGVAIVMVAFQLPFGIWIMKGFFDNVSWDMECSALIDGASRFQVWWKIMMPNIKPGIAALSIFTFISGWNAYLIPYTFTVGRAGKSTVLSVYLKNFMGESAMTEWNMVAAVGLFQLIPVLIFFFFTQEALLNIYGGGAKGGA
ncbi:carbohydrate ABC transporter permease [Candidatus Atribacteria bacterium HGW-Atribacteria-1]|nr:MAG: carbohydrate ABC transporter permease [Candidatus Atribacteria bacterium HGW-Atribacteria-1]